MGEAERERVDRPVAAPDGGWAGEPGTDDAGAAPEPGVATVPVGASSMPPGHVPPRSPAYAAGDGGAPFPVAREAPPGAADPRAADRRAADPLPVDAGLRTVPRSRGRERFVRMLPVLAVAALAVVAVGIVVPASDDAPDAEAVGELAVADRGTTVVDGSRTAPAEVGTVVEAGDVIRAPVDGAVTVDLPGGGVIRFDAGATVTFTGEGADPGSGRREGEAPLRVGVAAGRVWVNPPEGAAVEVGLAGGRVASRANPVAVECPADCTIQAPAAGVEIDGGGGGTAAPVPAEVVTLRADGSMALARTPAATAWAAQNLAADRAAGLDEPRPGDERGVVASAVLDGTYPVRIGVTGAPRGASLPASLVYSTGETYDLRLTAAGRACRPASCEVPVEAAEGATGTATVGDGRVEVSFGRPIDCYDESGASVAVPGIGTVTVTATLEVTSVAHDGSRWRIAAASGPGTVSTTLTTPCNAGDALGTSTSTTSVTAG